MVVQAELVINTLIPVCKDPLVLMLLFLLVQMSYMFEDLFLINVCQLTC